MAAEKLLRSSPWGKAAAATLLTLANRWLDAGNPKMATKLAKVAETLIAAPVTFDVKKFLGFAFARETQKPASLKPLRYRLNLSEGALDLQYKNRLIQLYDDEVQKDLNCSLRQLANWLKANGVPKAVSCTNCKGSGLEYGGRQLGHRPCPSCMGTGLHKGQL